MYTTTTNNNYQWSSLGLSAFSMSQQIFLLYVWLKLFAKSMALHIAQSLCKQSRELAKQKSLHIV
jgi:hypothetical protein